MSSRIIESTVADAPVEELWAFVRELDLAKIIPHIVSKSELIHGLADQIGSVRHVTFYDGTTWDVKLVELSDYAHLLTYELVTSEPPMVVSALVNTIKLQNITTTHQTFVEWRTDFSRDVSPAVLEDCRYKRRDMLVDLSRAVRIQNLFDYPMPTNVEELHKLPPPQYNKFVSDLDTVYRVCLPHDLTELAALMNGIKARYPRGIDPAQWTLVCRQLGFPKAMQGPFFQFLDLNKDGIITVQELTLRFLFNLGIDTDGVGSPTLCKTCFELLDLDKSKKISYAQLQDFAFFIALRQAIRSHKPVVLGEMAQAVDAQLKEFMRQAGAKDSLTIREFSTFWLE